MEPITERRISTRAFIAPYALAGIAACLIAAVCFSVSPFAAPLALLPPAGVYVYTRLARLCSCYRVYPDRLEVESGIFSRSIENVELFRVRDVGLRQGLLGRIAGFGDVYVQSTDASMPAVVVRSIDDPKALYQQLRQLVSESRALHRTMIVEEGQGFLQP